MGVFLAVMIHSHGCQCSGFWIVVGCTLYIMVHYLSVWLHCHRVQSMIQNTKNNSDARENSYHQQTPPMIHKFESQFLNLFLSHINTWTLSPFSSLCQKPGWVCVQCFWGSVYQGIHLPIVSQLTVCHKFSFITATNRHATMTQEIIQGDDFTPFYPRVSCVFVLISMG